MKLIIIVLLASMNISQAKSLSSVFIPQVGLVEEGIVLTVLSSGCTKKTDFSIVLSEDSSMTITRLRLDRCRAKVRPIELLFSFEELGVTKPVNYL